MLFFYFTTRVGQKVPRQNKSIFMTVKTKASSKNISVTIIPSDEEADKTLNQTFLFSTTLEMSILHQQQNENGTVHAHTRTLCSFFSFFFFLYHRLTCACQNLVNATFSKCLNISAGPARIWEYHLECRWKYVR